MAKARVRLLSNNQELTEALDELSSSGQELGKAWRLTRTDTVQQAWDAFMSSALPVAGFAIIEAATLAEVIDIVSRTPCAIAHGVVEVWPLQESP
jgi:hypothetical protein